MLRSRRPVGFQALNDIAFTFRFPMQYSEQSHRDASGPQNNREKQPIKFSRIALATLAVALIVASAPLSAKQPVDADSAVGDKPQ